MERCFLRIRLNAHHPTVTIAAELCDLALLYSNGRVQQLGWGFKELRKDLQDFNLKKGLRDVLYLNKMVSVVLEFLVIFCDLGLINSTRTNANSRDSREGNPNQVPA